MLELLKTLLVRRDAFVREVLLPYGAGLDQKNILLNLVMTTLFYATTRYKALKLALTNKASSISISP